MKTSAPWGLFWIRLAIAGIMLLTRSQKAGLDQQDDDRKEDTER